MHACVVKLLDAQQEVSAGLFVSLFCAMQLSNLLRSQSTRVVVDRYTQGIYRGSYILLNGTASVQRGAGG